MKKIEIRTWTEEIPSNGIAVVFDIFRCSTTLHCLANNQNVSSLWIAPSLKLLQEEQEEQEEQVKVEEFAVFSELRGEIRCKERYDNSPFSAQKYSSPHHALVATTSGTPAMFSARNCREVFVGALVNFSALVKYLQKQDLPIVLIPAAKPGVDHVEDMIVAEAIALALEDSFVEERAKQAREKILASPRPKHLAEKISTGEKDCTIATKIDLFSKILKVEFSDSPYFAKVSS